MSLAHQGTGDDDELPGLPRRDREEDRQDARGAVERGRCPWFTPQSKAGDFATWLKDDYDVGRGHAMALFGVLKNATISDKHVDSGGTHSDPSAELRLDGIDRR